MGWRPLLHVFEILYRKSFLSSAEGTNLNASLIPPLPFIQLSFFVIIFLLFFSLFHWWETRTDALFWFCRYPKVLTRVLIVRMCITERRKTKRNNRSNRLYNNKLSPKLNCNNNYLRARQKEETKNRCDQRNSSNGSEWSTSFRIFPAFFYD